MKKSDVDWSQSRVIFISPDFTPYQQEAINFKNLAISLWKIKRYDHHTVSFEEVKRLNPAATLNLVPTGDNALDVVSREIVVYTENDRLRGVSEVVLGIYEQLRELIMELGGVEIKATKLYVVFTVNGSNFVDVAWQKKGLKLWINLCKGELDDPYALARDVSRVGHHGNGDYEIQVDSVDKLDYILTLIKQAYRKK